MMLPSLCCSSKHVRCVAVQKRMRRVAVRPASLANYPARDSMVPIPLDLYDILQVNQDASIEECSAAYAQLIKVPKDSGYSEDCVWGRSELLKYAADVLLDRDARKLYNSEPTQVMYASLPGALAYLQETQRPEAVIELAQVWLEASSDTTGCADVALAMALSYCDLANEALASGDGKVGDGFEQLLKASFLLADYNCGPHLADDIASGLDELAETYLKERLNDTMHSTASPERQCALEYLRSEMWATGPAGPLALSCPGREAILAELRPLMTAAEIIALYVNAPAELPRSELYDLAFACIAEAVRVSKPELITDAQDILDQLEKEMDVHVERAVCALLLGDVPGTQSALRLTSGSLTAPDADVVAFLFEYGESDEEQLGGVCALVERWVNDVLVTSFRGFPRAFKFSLDEWGSSEQVQNFLSAHEPQGYVESFVSRIAAALRGLFAALVLSLAGAAQRLGLRPVADSLSSLAGGRSHLARGRAADGAVPGVSTAGRGALHAALNCVALLSTGALCLMAATLLARRVVAFEAAQPPAAAAGADSAAVAPAALSVRATGDELAFKADMAAFKNTLLAWQEVKQLAMGAQHDISALDTVLEGNMLQHWRTRAAHVKRINWHWRYQVNKITIQKAHMLKKDAAKLEVSIQEKADAVYNGEVQDTYENDYSIEYHLVNRDSGWKVSGSRVLNPNKGADGK